MKQLIGIFLILLSVNGVAAAEPQKEVLIGFVRHEQGMVFQVYSGGCTFKEDFQIVTDRKPDKITLTLYRVNPDYCKSVVPFGRYITFTYAELNIFSRQPVEILNSLNPGYIY